MTMGRSRAFYDALRRALARSGYDDEHIVDT
jgi:hypothetical protein